MSRITITSRDAEKIARSFSDLIAEKGLLRIRRKAINTVGAAARKKTRSILPDVIGTSAALMVQGQAARPGSDNPRYSLRMARKIPIGKLRAKNRKITRRQWPQGSATHVAGRRQNHVQKYSPRGCEVPPAPHRLAA